MVRNRISGYHTHYFGPLVFHTRGPQQNLGAYAPGPVGKLNSDSPGLVITPGGMITPSSFPLITLVFIVSTVTSSLPSSSPSLPNHHSHIYQGSSHFNLKYSCMICLQTLSILISSNILLAFLN